MLGLKIIVYTAIFLTSSAIGLIQSRRYLYRVEELREFKNALNMFKTKIKFTYEPIPEIFNQIAMNSSSHIGNVFKAASYNMKLYPAGEAWIKAMDGDMLNINVEDKKILKDLSRLLGATDLNGQLSQIELTNSFLDEQIEKASNEMKRSEALYRKLGMIVGLGIVVILL